MVLINIVLAILLIGLGVSFTFIGIGICPFYLAAYAYDIQSNI